MLSVLTPTGGRPEALARLALWMRAQTTAEPVRWVIVDDCEPMSPTPKAPAGWDVRHVRREPYWQPGQMTLAANILAGLDHCTDRVAICEDDDWYHPDWLSVIGSSLVDHAVAGQAPTTYYHLPSGTARDMNNRKHASLCATGVARSGLDRLREVCRAGHDLIDVRLWQGGGYIIDAMQDYHVGIKGLPGRPGHGVGHRLTGGQRTPLAQLIGNDAGHFP